jgi:hypothetical protein
MIPLPSGKTVGISNIRARYHALRLNRKVDSRTPRSELLDLVDIVTNPDESKQLPYHYHPRFQFTGHTLSNLASMNSWSAEDRRIFSEWLSQESQVRVIEQTRARLFSEELPLTEQHYDYPEKLYSQLTRRIAQLRMGRATVKQWRNTLMNMKQQGIREEEITWSGVLPFLQNYEARSQSFVTKQEILDSIDFSAIRLSLTNELAFNNQCELDFIEVPQFRLQDTTHNKLNIANPGEVCVLRYVEPLHYYKVGFFKTLTTVADQSNQLGNWFALDTTGTPILNQKTNNHRFSSKEVAFEAASEHALRHVGVPVEYTPCRRYEYKTLCGGENYLEWLVSLPDYPISHFTSHYHTRNLLVHFRTKERFDTLGRKLLFIEEIQSDWHQSGAMHGYLNRWPGTVPPAPFRKEWVALALKLLLQHVASCDLQGVAWSTSDIQESHYSKRMSPVSRLYDETIPRSLLRLTKNIGGAISSCRIPTKEPRLQIRRQTDKWSVSDKQGNFATRPRYSQQDAIRVMARHCKQITLDIPVLMLDQSMKDQVCRNGFPIFGDQ